MPGRGRRLDEDGGETVQVEVKVNGQLKYVRYASITGEPGGNMRRYVTDAGDEIRVNRNLGYRYIAQQLL